MIKWSVSAYSVTMPVQMTSVEPLPIPNAVIMLAQ